jgi:site-specific DNA recombinase
MEPEDKKSLLRAMISSIEIYNTPKGKHADGHLIKTIHFTFPVTYDGESGVLFVSSTSGEVETVVLMSRNKE